MGWLKGFKGICVVDGFNNTCARLAEYTAVAAPSTIRSVSLSVPDLLTVSTGLTKGRALGDWVEERLCVHRG